MITITLLCVQSDQSSCLEIEGPGVPGRAYIRSRIVGNSSRPFESHGGDASNHSSVPR